jgi:hypothetical protein
LRSGIVQGAWHKHCWVAGANPSPPWMSLS